MDPPYTTPSYAAQETPTTSINASESLLQRATNFITNFITIPPHLALLALELTAISYTPIYYALITCFPLVPSITIRLNQLIITPILNPSIPAETHSKGSLSDWFQVPAGREESLKATLGLMAALSSALVTVQDWGYFKKEEVLASFGGWGWLVWGVGRAGALFVLQLSTIMAFAIFQGEVLSVAMVEAWKSGSWAWGTILFRLWVGVECGLYLWWYAMWVVNHQEGDGCSANFWDYWKGNCWEEIAGLVKQ
ncbi:hypothetical protein BJ508DRAFT_331114 [Ascobolus immersus RN42]|uniref:Uncharacterized protein n=1 Tax=Ascobolus immersus RN42 TaxID=1160509 RepID=A0A3N4HWU3_ASCIM|nr:hypothetical protein BJ508DRAFT_331114 [Ascobolus immersus RN42]